MPERPAYNPEQIEKKWQKRWLDSGVFNAEFPSDKPKYYCLIEFPYPSGNGLHVGHPRSNTALDIIARKRRMEGYNVLYPIGYDAFGLPTENYAIKNKVHPAVVTKKNIDHFRQQLQRLGFSFDYTREVNTTDPSYYKWTQWIFLKLLENGLAYKAEMPINWCTGCKCGLANEEVVGGVCERCGSQVVRRVKSQWMLRITKYAQKLLDGLDHMSISSRRSRPSSATGSAAARARRWTSSSPARMRSCACLPPGPTRSLAATYMVVSPEHPLIEKYKDEIANYAAIAAYRDEAAKKSDFERTELAKDKTRPFRSTASAPSTLSMVRRIPIWVQRLCAHELWYRRHHGRCLRMTPATGSSPPSLASPWWRWFPAATSPRKPIPISWTACCATAISSTACACPTPRRRSSTGWWKRAWASARSTTSCVTGCSAASATGASPSPWCTARTAAPCPLPESDLPVLLPDVENYEPTDSGESPLATMTDWVNTTCPKCGGPAKRETDTMPQWAGSSWYFLRYCDPHNDKEFASQEALDYFMPVDWYNGGMEHTTLHLLYSRFWHLFLHDLGLVKAPEPYQKRTSHGMILGENNEKMSKSRGNVINPDDIVNELGADAFRLYEMFMGAFDQAIPWSTNGARGCRRFLDRVVAASGHDFARRGLLQGTHPADA